MIRTVDAPVFNGVAASSTATCKLPIGGTIKAMDLILGGTFDETDISEIRLKINNETRWKVTGSELNLMNLYDGMADCGAAPNTILRLNFEMFMNRQEAQVSTALVTGRGPGMKEDAKVVYQAQVEVDIDATPTSPTLSASLEYEDGVIGMGGRALGQLDAGDFRTIHRIVVDAGGAGDYTFNDFPRGDAKNRLFRRAFVTLDANDITQLNVTRVLPGSGNRDEFFVRSTALNERIIDDYTPQYRTVQSSFNYTIDATEDGNGRYIPLLGLSALEWKFTFSGAAQATILYETIGRTVSDQ